MRDFGRDNVRSKNRHLGEYSNDYFAVGYIVDAEYSVLRDPIATSCTGGMRRFRNGSVVPPSKAAGSRIETALGGGRAWRDEVVVVLRDPL